jgi:hypothetical protein
VAVSPSSCTPPPYQPEDQHARTTRRTQLALSTRTPGQIQPALPEKAELEPRAPSAVRSPVSPPTLPHRPPNAPRDIPPFLPKLLRPPGPETDDVAASASAGARVQVVASGGGWVARWWRWDARRDGDRRPPPPPAAARSGPPRARRDQAQSRLPPPPPLTDDRPALASAMDALSRPAVVIDNGTGYAPPAPPSLSLGRSAR